MYFTVTQRLLGLRLTVSVTRGWASKNDNYNVSFAHQGTINTKEYAQEKQVFTRRNSASDGIDLADCEELCGKV